MERKRKPIRQRVRRVVLLITIISLVLTSVVGLVSMLRIRNQSEAALVAETQQNLTNIVADKAELANSEFGKYADQTRLFADYLHELYANPELYVPREVQPTDPKNAGIYITQIGYTAEGYENRNEESMIEERELLANLEDLLRPVMTTEGSDIVAIYYGTVNGQILCFDNQSDNKPPEGTAFPFTETVWWQAAEAAGDVCFTDVYLDGFGRGLTITCAAPFYDANDAFAGVIGVDILITNVYDSIVAMDLGEGAFATLVDSAGGVISPDGTEQTIQDTDLNDSEITQVLSGDTGILLSESGAYHAYTPVESVGWTLLVHVPQSLILAPVGAMDRNIYSSIILFIIIFLAILLIVMLSVQRFAQSLTDPLITLGKDVKEISGGNLDYRATVQDNDEIGDVAESFNEMAASLKRHIEDLTHVTAERERMGAELGVATKIQADMLPSKFPAFPERKEFDIYATMTPAKEVGGDFFDFFLIDDDHLALVMADVSGKGVPAALFMVIAKTLIKNRATATDTPAKILYDVNNGLCEGNEAELFVTVWLGILTISTGKLVMANAGHEYPAIRKAGETYTLIRGDHCPPLAAEENTEYVNEELVLEPGDSLFVYTDGVSEAKDENGKRFGLDQMLTALNKAPAESEQELLQNVKTAIDGFVGDAAQFDDITMLGLRYFGKN